MGGFPVTKTKALSRIAGHMRTLANMQMTQEEIMQHVGELCRVVCEDVDRLREEAARGIKWASDAIYMAPEDD